MLNACNGSHIEMHWIEHDWFIIYSKEFGVDWVQVY